MCGVYVACVCVCGVCGGWGSVGGVVCMCICHVYVVFICVCVYICVDGVVCIYVVWDVCMYLWFMWGVYVNGGIGVCGHVHARV